MPEQFDLTDEERDQVFAFAHWLNRHAAAVMLGELTPAELDALVDKYPGMAEYNAWKEKRSRAARKGAATRRRNRKAKEEGNAKT
jgi:hypothetical protein